MENAPEYSKKAQRDKNTFAPGLYSKTPQKESAALIYNI